MPLKTYSITTLGCRVNQYEAEQLATLLRGRGLFPAPAGEAGDVQVVHTCSVTVQAASKSRQTVRRAGTSGPVSLPVVQMSSAEPSGVHLATLPGIVKTQTQLQDQPERKLIVTGCWATSDPAAARALPGVDAVVTHHDDVATTLHRLLDDWLADPTPEVPVAGTHVADAPLHAAPLNISMEKTKGGASTNSLLLGSKPSDLSSVNEKMGAFVGMSALPLLHDHQTGRQRGLLKIQDGCDAHCTYCIIPKLRPGVRSKPIADAVEEARQLVAGGHVELVLTGIFLGAFGQPTALRRRQPAGQAPLADLVEALCTKVPGLRRLRLSSLEPGDLTDDLVSALKSHPQVVPHFHLPLQSGSDAILRKMNRQYGRDDFLEMVDRVRSAFDRPALTTDVIVGFPGETDEEFARTCEVAEHAGFIHIHAFHFSPRPGTAAARWQKDFIRGPVVNGRVDALRAIADRHSFTYRRTFLGQDVELLVEHESDASERKSAVVTGQDSRLRHGRAERYFPVWFELATAVPGDFVRVRVTEVTPTRTHGVMVGASTSL